MDTRTKISSLINSMFDISAHTCVEALANAFLYRRLALQAELAVGLVIFAAEGETTKQSKNRLKEIYASAGYLCMTARDADYKNVNKRINISATLFNTITLRKVRRWIGEYREADIINALIHELEPFQFATLDDVLEFCGRPTNKTQRQRANDKRQGELSLTEEKTLGGPLRRRASDVEPEGTIHIDTEAVHLRIPPTVEPNELLEVAMRLLEIAKAREREAANVS